MAVTKKKKNVKPKTYVAMDMGGHSIKFAVGIFQNGKLRVNQMFIQTLPMGIYENGIIKNVVALEETIRKAIRDNKVKEKDVVITVESSDVIKREMSIPKVDPADMLDLISYEVGQYLPIEINNYVLQYKVIKEERVNDKEMVQILLGAMPKDMAKAHFDVLKSAGLNPVAMDLHTNVLSKLIAHLRSIKSPTLNPEDTKSFTKTTAFIDFGYERIDINIMEGDVNRFNRILRMGISGVDDIIATHLNIEKSEVEAKRLKFSDESMIALRKAYEALNTLHDVHHYKDDDGIEISEGDLSNEQNGRVYAIRDTFDYLYMCLDEIDKVFKYYVSRSMDYKIDQIVLYGGATLNKDFTRFVQERLDIPCYPFDASQYATLQLRNVQDSPIKFVNALGALIRS